MQGILYEEPAFWLFVLITCILGGGAAWITGRATATSWRGWPTLIVSILALGVAVRFIHHALFGGTMFTLHYYVVDTIVLLVIGSLGYRVTRARQMTTQYSWLYERTGPMSWRPRAAETVRNETG
jgi:small-conductance mechanosensitive channel